MCDDTVNLSVPLQLIMRIFQDISVITPTVPLAT